MKERASVVESQFFLSGRIHTSSGLNCISHAVRLRGPLSSERLGHALAEIVHDQIALRTRFSEDGGEVVKIVTSGDSHRLVIIDAEATDTRIAQSVLHLWRSLARGEDTWGACLLRHDPTDHTFLFVAQRSVWDETSSRLLGRLISAKYSGEPLSLSPLAERTTEASDAGEYFNRLLGDAPTETNLPLAAARSTSTESRVDELRIELSEGTAASLNTWANSRSIEPWLVIAGAVATVLSSYCAQRRIIVGLPVDLRVGQAIGPLGSLSAMLPFATPDNSSLAGLAEALSEFMRDASAYGSVPFAELARRFGGASTQAHPLFQVAFVPETPLSLALPDCHAEPLGLPAPPQLVDLFVHCSSTGFRLVFKGDLLRSELMQGLGASILTWLEAALSAPTKPTAELPLLGAGQAESSRQAPPAPSLLEEDLFELVSGHFVSRAEQTAVVFDGRPTTYGELDSLVRRFASQLLARQIEPGDLVGVCLTRGVEMLASILAVLRVGAAYVPLDPNFPHERLRYMVEHSGLRHFLTSRSNASTLSDFCEAILVEEAPDVADECKKASVPGRSRAYVIYTSGSSGLPKGVAVPREAAANFLQSMMRRPGINETDVLCAVTTLSFDISVLELLAPLAAGGTVVIASEGEGKDPRLLANLLVTSGATILQATPVTWQMLCAANWQGSGDLKALCGGESLSPSLAHQLLPKVGELWNMYGPTETTVWSTCQRIMDADAPVSVGTVIDNTTIRIFDEHRRIVPVGVEGTLFIGGAGVALGYLNDQQRTSERFVSDPTAPEKRIYDTGDRARLGFDGLLYVLGRNDFQVKIRGFRVELGEIEARLTAHESVLQAIVLPTARETELTAYYLLNEGARVPDVAHLRAHCGATLPTHMVPSHYVKMVEFPRTPNGKVDRKAFPAPKSGERRARKPLVTRQEGAIQRELFDIWHEVLGIAPASVSDSFFDLGGTSILAFEVALKISEKFRIEMPVLKVFEYPTVATLAKYVKGSRDDSSFIDEAKQRASSRRATTASPKAFDVAIIGMAGRFPGARDLDAFWQNLISGRETITFFDRAELDLLIPEQDRTDPAYIPARGILEDIDLFDADFFGISASEAELMDPQLRIFHEVAWEAFENAGYVGAKIPSPVGVWAGMGNNFYYLYHVLTRSDRLAVVGDIAAEIANEKDHIAPRVSHRLNLMGPSLSVHTACSTGLVTVDNAYQALISGQVDVALAGAVDVRTPQKSGQRFEEGGIFSHDGHCRPFDAEASGTMFGEGVGAVVLKRLLDAERDGDTIHAVIKGTAVNHDGGNKVSYLAPGVEGQARLIASAVALSGVDPETIGFVEAHGTATPIGDPIEVEALTRVYRGYTRKRNYCALGSVKGNFGHATTAAGIAGLLKIVLSLKEKKIPPTLHFREPNPRLNLPLSPFFVNSTLMDWKASDTPRRGAVSSFGFCGTNAHAILEEAPPLPALDRPTRKGHLFVVSGKTKKALDENAAALSAAIKTLSPGALADAAYTTLVGRERFQFRRCAVVFDSTDEAAFVQPVGPKSASLNSEIEDPAVAFVFPGQGSQYVNMGRSLYREEQAFSEAVDRCCEGLKETLGCDLRDYLFPQPGDEERATESLNNTFYTQPAIFTMGYAIAQQLMSWGVKPHLFVGHSIGEFVAATLAGVMKLDDALRLVATRGRLMRDLPRGRMMSVRLSAEEVMKMAPGEVDLAAVNAPSLTVVAGPNWAIEAFEKELIAMGVTCRILHTSHAFHSSMMDPVVEPFLEVVQGIELSAPTVPIVSTVTGDWISDEELCDPSYWARHLRQPVLFSQAIQVALDDPDQILVECGPRRTSTTLALQHRPKNPDRVIATMPDSAEPEDETAALLLAAGALWLNGANLDASALHNGERRRRVPLPTYRFQRRRYWLEPGNVVSFGLGGKTSALATKDSLPPLEQARPLAANAQQASLEGTSSPAVAPRDVVVQAIIDLIGEVQGGPLESPDEDARFITLGLDSLILTQLSRALRARMKSTVTFRQLTEDYSTLRLLADAIKQQNPEFVQQQGSTAAPFAPPTKVMDLETKERFEAKESDAPPPPSRRFTPISHDSDGHARAPDQQSSARPGSAPPSSPQERGGLSGVRLGRDRHGRPAWFVPDPKKTGAFIRINKA